MNYKYILTAILIVAIFSGTASAAWANASYTHAKNITLLGADTELTNYPYLVSVAKESAMQSDFDDLIFYDQPVSQDGNLINFEIETYNATTATVWLNITTLPITGKTVSVYYGNAVVTSTENSNATWNSDYVGVWQLSDEISPILTWNNYKQPDGVLNTTVVVEAGCSYIQEPSVYYIDGEFKLWANIDPFMVGYFNSSNGYNWVYQGALRNDTGELVAAGHPFLMQDPDSSGYLLYTHPACAPATKDLWYSSGNETLFTLEKEDCINGSDFGSSHIGNTFVWKENTSDWYAICEHNNPSWTSIYGTSSNGRDWIWHDAVVASGLGSNFLGGPFVWKNNGTYYMLFHAAMTGVIPTDIYIATSTDRQNWTYVSGFEVTREYWWEGVENSAGQTADPHLLEYDNEVYIFYEGIHDQSSPFTALLGLIHLNQTLIEVSDAISGGADPIIADSTSNTNNGTRAGGESVTGIIGDAIEFSSDHISIDTSDFYNLGTVSWWQNTSADSNVVFIGAEDTNALENRCQMGTTDLGRANTYIRNETYIISHLLSDANTILLNEYQHIAWTSNADHTKCFVNGTEVSLSVSEGMNDGTWFSDIPNINRYDIGAYYGSTPSYFSGIMDEVELSKSVRSSDWINLSYQMVVDDSYVTFGAEQTYGSTGGAYNITLPLGWSIIGWTDTTDRTAHYMGGLIGGNCSYVVERNRTTGSMVYHNMAGPEGESNFAIERGWGYYVSIIAETLWERDI